MRLSYRRFYLFFWAVYMLLIWVLNWNLTFWLCHLSWSYLIYNGFKFLIHIVWVAFCQYIRCDMRTGVKHWTLAITRVISLLFLFLFCRDKVFEQQKTLYPFHFPSICVCVCERHVLHNLCLLGLNGLSHPPPLL